jgi:hypothetical protein
MHNKPLYFQEKPILFVFFLVKKENSLSLNRNITDMKRKLLFGTAFLFLAWAATSCESISGCKVCKYVIYENGAVVSSGSETEYCGTDLVKQQAIPDVTVGKQTTKVECH